MATSSLQLFAALLLACQLGPAAAGIYDKVTCDSNINGTIYDYSAKPLNGSLLASIDFTDYEGQVVLITNVASYDDLCTESYLQLNELASMYQGQPFAILAFPTQQFGRREPGITSDEIYNALRYVRPGNGFEPAFQLFVKTSVNGEGEEAVFTFLKNACSYTEDEFNIGLEYTPLHVKDVRQTFEKFLVTKTGVPQYRYHARLTNSADLTADIDELLSA